MIWDLAIIETGNGGDFTIDGNDLAVCNSIESAIYLALFGGNVEASTKLPRVLGEQDFSYWANSLFMGAFPSQQFNSLTERTLNTTELGTAAVSIIENAIRQDLSFLNILSLLVSIISTDRISVSMKLIIPKGLSKIVTFYFVRNRVSGDFDLTDFNFNDFF